MKLPPAVIPLPWRLPKTAATPHLPPDVLFSIATYLSFSDRLNLAGFSRCVHSVVLFITELICLRTKQIWKLHAYLHGDLKTRAPCLVSLSLHFQDLYDWSDAFSLEETYEIVLTILRVATNLRHISTDNDWQWNAASTQAPVHRVLEVMGGMPHLQSLLINAPTHKVLLSPSLFAVSLKKLHIRSYRGLGNLSFPHLCRSLTHLPSLESLTLEFFPAKCFAKLNTQGRLPALQSIRNLELIQTWLPYHTHRHLPTIFPNLLAYLAAHSLPSPYRTARTPQLPIAQACRSTPYQTTFDADHVCSLSRGLCTSRHVRRIPLLSIPLLLSIFPSRACFACAAQRVEAGGLVQGLPLARARDPRRRHCVHIIRTGVLPICARTVCHMSLPLARHREGRSLARQVPPEGKPVFPQTPLRCPCKPAYGRGRLEGGLWYKFDTLEMVAHLAKRARSGYRGDRDTTLGGCEGKGVCT